MGHNSSPATADNPFGEPEGAKTHFHHSHGRGGSGHAALTAFPATLMRYPPQMSRALYECLSGTIVTTRAARFAEEHMNRGETATKTDGEKDEDETDENEGEDGDDDQDEEADFSGRDG